MKKILVAIPTYNRIELLKKLIKTIPDNVDIHISDNGSFIKDIFNQNNLTLEHHDKIYSMFENWNLSIINAPKCDFIAITSDDDLYEVNSFNIIKKIINSYEDIDMFIFGNNFINEKDEIIGQYCPKEYKIFNAPEGLNEFLYGVDARMPSIFFKKTFLDSIGYFDDSNFKFTAADSELIQRALLLGKVVFIPKIVSSYRVWSGSETDKKIATKEWMDQIDIWTNKIIKLANSELADTQNTFDWKKYKDEIYARNLLAGLNNLYKNKNYKEVVEHFLACRYPKNAMFKTKIRIFKTLILSKIKAFFVS